MKPSDSEFKTEEIAGLTRRPAPLGLHRGIMARVAAVAARRKEDLITSASIGAALVLLCLGWYLALHSYVAAGTPGLRTALAFASRHADAFLVGMPLLWMLSLAAVAATLRAKKRSPRVC